MPNNKLLKMLQDLEMMLPEEAIVHLDAIRDVVEKPEMPEGKEAAEPVMEEEIPMPMPEEEMPV